MKSSNELAQKANELDALLEVKRQALTDALVDGKDPDKLLSEIARLENESKSTRAAASIAAKREAEQAERERIARAAEAGKQVDKLAQDGTALISGMLQNLLDIADLNNQLKAVDAQQQGLLATHGLHKPTVLATYAQLSQALTQAIEAVKVKLDFMGVYDRENPVWLEYGRPLADIYNNAHPNYSVSAAPAPKKAPAKGSLFKRPVKQGRIERVEPTQLTPEQAAKLREPITN